jgi:superfamily II helicase
MAECLATDPPVDWELVAQWSVAAMQGKSLKSSLCKLCLGGAVYHLWHQRNALLHGHTLKTEEAIVEQIKWEVRSRIFAKGSAKSSVRNLDLVYRWNLHRLLRM